MIGDFILGGSPSELVAAQAGIVLLAAAHVKPLHAIRGMMADRLPHDQVVGPQVLERQIGCAKFENHRAAEVHEHRGRDGPALVRSEHDGRGSFLRKMTPDV